MKVTIKKRTFNITWYLVMIALFLNMGALTVAMFSGTRSDVDHHLLWIIVLYLIEERHR